MLNFVNIQHYLYNLNNQKIIYYLNDNILYDYISDSYKKKNYISDNVQ